MIKDIDEKVKDNLLDDSEIDDIIKYEKLVLDEDVQWEEETLLCILIQSHYNIDNEKNISKLKPNTMYKIIKPSLY